MFFMAASWDSRAAWPRRLVSATVTSWSADSAFWMTTWVRGVTDEAEGLTTIRIFTPPWCPLRRRRSDRPTPRWAVGDRRRREPGVDSGLRCRPEYSAGASGVAAHPVRSRPSP